MLALRALVAEAERAEQKALVALERIERDYIDGPITADQWARLEGKLTEEHAGAKAEVERLSHQLADIARWGVDAEQAALERLTELRAAIAGEVRDAAGLEAVRAALMRLFEAFIIHRDGGSHSRIDAMVRN